MYRNKDEFIVQSRAAFTTERPMSLLDLRQVVAQTATGHKRRDILSALDSVVRLFAVKLETVPASRKAVREVFAARTPSHAGISPKRFANIRACVASAIRDYGIAPPPITKRLPLMPSWRALLDRIENRNHRWALYRLASYCSHMKVEPADVDSDILIGLFEALQAEEVVKNPRRLLKHTIAHWNMCKTRVAGWPSNKLSSPFERSFIRIRKAEFPRTFRDDVRRWENKLLKGDPIDLTAPARALSEATVRNDSATVLRFASALVHSGVKIGSIRTLKDLVSLGHFKLGLKFFLRRFRDERTPYIAKIAATLIAIAKHHCRLKPASLAEHKAILKRLEAGHIRQMADRNRVRLRQFDDPKNVVKLLCFWQEERERGLAHRNPYRAAKCFERALAAALLTFCCLRIQTLRTIDLTTDVRRIGLKCFLSIDASKVKNRQHLEFELPKGVAALLAEYVRDYRPRLLGTEGPYLFPGKGGKPRAAITMYNDFIAAMRRHTGLVVNPHLMRHIIAKIVVERQPDLAFAISRVLGHARMNMTMSHYLGTEGRAAGRHIELLLTDVVQGKFTGT